MPAVTKVVTKLADGRELIYFDQLDLVREAPPDQRELPARPGVGEARQDARTGDWVVIANHRQTRIFMPDVQDCPLCPSREGHHTEIPAADYGVAVFENRFPALAGLGSETSAEVGDGLLPSAPARGRCEVICFDSRHDVSFADLDVRQVGLVVEAWIDRTRWLSEQPGIAQVFCFENRGPEIGVTQPHPHGQVYAYPFVLPRTARMLQRAAAYRHQRGTNLFDDLVAAEIGDGRRLVAENADWVAFVPFASRWPYEVHLYPRNRRRDLPSLDEQQRASFAALYLDLLGRFDRLFDTPAPYISAWHQAPVADREFAAHLELFTNRRSSTRLKYTAGTEAGMDSFSNDVVPEEAAARLREVVA